MLPAPCPALNSVLPRCAAPRCAPPSAERGQPRRGQRVLLAGAADHPGRRALHQALQRGRGAWASLGNILCTLGLWWRVRCRQAGGQAGSLAGLVQGVWCACWLTLAAGVSLPGAAGGQAGLTPSSPFNLPARPPRPSAALRADLRRGPPALWRGGGGGVRQPGSEPGRARIRRGEAG